MKDNRIIKKSDLQFLLQAYIPGTGLKLIQLVQIFEIASVHTIGIHHAKGIILGTFGVKDLEV